MRCASLARAHARLLRARALSPSLALSAHRQGAHAWYPCWRVALAAGGPCTRQHGMPMHFGFLVSLAPPVQGVPMPFGFLVSGFGFRVQGFGFQVQGAGLGFRVGGKRFRVSGFRSKAEGLGQPCGVPRAPMTRVVPLRPAPPRHLLRFTPTHPHTHTTTHSHTHTHSLSLTHTAEDSSCGTSPWKARTAS